MSDTRALAGRIRISIQDVKNSVIRAIELSDKASKSGDDDLGWRCAKPTWYLHRD